MKHREDWKHILRHAWSVRLMVLSGILCSLEVVLPLFIDAMPRNVFAALSVLASVAGVYSRTVVQPAMERRKQPRTRGSVADFD